MDKLGGQPVLGLRPLRLCCSLARLSLESDLRAEKEQRQHMQRELQREQDNSAELRTQLQQLQGLQKVCVRAGLRASHGPSHRGHLCPVSV